MFEVTRLLLSAVNDRRVIVPFVALISLATACGQPDSTPPIVGSADCQVTGVPSAPVTRRDDPGVAHRSSLSVGRRHNKDVTTVIANALSRVPEDATPEELLLAIVPASGDYAAANGLDRRGYEQLARAQIVFAADDARTSRPIFRRAAAAVRNLPGVQDRVAELKRSRDSLRGRRDEARLRRNGSVGLMSANGPLSTVDAYFAIMDEGFIDTEEYPTANYNTSVYVGSIISGFSAEESDTVYAVEEVTDSSRAYWESLALELWIEAGGDTTIFMNASLTGCQPDRPVSALLSSRVPACPICITAAIAGGIADVESVVDDLAENTRTDADIAGRAVISSSIHGFGTMLGGAAGTSLAGRLAGWIARRAK